MRRPDCNRNDDLKAPARSGAAVRGPIFNAAVHDWDEHLTTLNAFWSSVMLTSGRYKGDPLGTHRKHPEIAPQMFDRWLARWAETLQGIFAPEAAKLFQMKAARIAESLKLGLFFRPEALRPKAS